MTALLLKRQEMAQAGPWEVEGKVDAQKIIDEVVALLWLPMVKGRMPCELKGLEEQMREADGGSMCSDLDVLENTLTGHTYLYVEKEIHIRIYRLPCM